MNCYLKLKLDSQSSFCIFLAVCFNESGEIEESRYLTKVPEVIIPPKNSLAEETERQVRAYLEYPRDFKGFDLPLSYANMTDHQKRVSQAIMRVKSGEKRTYGEIAKEINSSPQAVGGACRNNRLSLFVPDHRIVSAMDGLGGFKNYYTTGNRIEIKNGLLCHENSVKKRTD